MVRNTHGRKQKPLPRSADDPFGRVRNTRRAYKRPRHNDLESVFEDEEVEELEDFDASDELEEDDLDVLEQYVEPDEEDGD
jgi:hypothetical protein